MTIELCHTAIIELSCLLDLGWIQTSAWLTTTLPSRTTTPHADLDDFKATVRSAADRLPINQARALWLVDTCGATYAEGANETRTSEQQFAEQVRLARRTIGRSLT